jgi:hypothetical protein
MYRNITLAALFAVTFAGSAFADDKITFNPTPFVSSRTVAEVQAELARFKSGGTSPWSIQYNPLASFKSTASSEQVIAAYLASRSEVSAFSGEDAGSFYLSMTTAHAAGPTLAGRPRNNAQ